MLILALAGLQIVYHGSFFMKGFDYVMGKLPIDDTYYYLQTAWNVPRLGFVTFDGLHRTCGLQFLWFWLLAGLSTLIGSKIFLLYACLSTCILLNALCYWPIYRIGGMVRGQVFTLALALIWFNINLTTFRWYVCGMENSLHSLVLWMLLYQFLRTVSDERGEGGAGLIGLSILAVLNVWCRLDAALVSAFLYALAFWHFRKHAARGRQLMSAGVAAAGAAILFGGYYLMGGFFLPISGVIKTASLHGDSGLFGVLVARPFASSVPLGYLLPSALGEPARETFFPLGAGLLGSLAAVILLVRLTREGTGRALLLGWIALGLSSLVHLLVMSQMGTFASYGVWYQSPHFIFSTLTLGLAAQSVHRWLSAATKLGPRPMRALVVLGSTAYLVFAVGWFVRLARDPAPFQRSSFTAYKTSLWIRDHTQPGDIIAAFNAGTFGYYVDRRVIDLDGLVNDYPYYRDVLSGRIPLGCYLASNRVKYVVDYQIPESLLRVARVVHAEPVNRDGVTFLVLDVSALPPCTGPVGPNTT